LTISEEEARSAQQKENYKIIKEKDPSKIDFEKIKPIIGYVVNSGIGDPLHNEVVIVKIDQPFITLRGYAVGNQTKGTPVDKVEVSFNDSNTWHKASIVAKEKKDPSKKVFSWVLWEYTFNTNNYIDVNNQIKVTCKATDTEGTT
jgi:hypothetical protein